LEAGWNGNSGEYLLERHDEARSWLLEALGGGSGRSCFVDSAVLRTMPSGTVSFSSVRDMLSSCLLYGSALVPYEQETVSAVFRAVNHEKIVSIDWRLGLIMAPVHITTDGIALALVSFDRGLNSNQLPQNLASMFQLDRNSVSILSSRLAIDLTGRSGMVGSFSAVVELSNGHAIVFSYGIERTNNECLVGTKIMLFECVMGPETEWKTLGSLLRIVSAKETNTCGFCMLRDEESCCCPTEAQHLAALTTEIAANCSKHPRLLWSQYVEKWKRIYTARAISKQCVEVLDGGTGNLLLGPMHQLKVSAFRTSSLAPSIRAEKWLSAFAFQLSLLQDHPQLDLRLVRGHKGDSYAAQLSPLASSGTVIWSEQFNSEQIQRAEHSLIAALESSPHGGSGLKRHGDDEEAERAKKKHKRNFKCGDCGKLFIQGNHLREHVRTVHEMERPFMCDQCGRSFGQRCNLNKHIRNVHLFPDQRLFRCEKCPKSYKTKSKLKEHRCEGDAR